MDSSVHYTSQLLASRGFWLVVIGSLVSRNAQGGWGWGIGGIEQSTVLPQSCREHPLAYSNVWKVLCFCLPLTPCVLHDVCVLKFVNNQFEMLDFIVYQSYSSCHLLITIYKKMSDVLQRGGKNKKQEKKARNKRERVKKGGPLNQRECLIQWGKKDWGDKEQRQLFGEESRPKKIDWLKISCLGKGPTQQRLIN